MMNRNVEKTKKICGNLKTKSECKHEQKRRTCEFYYGLGNVRERKIKASFIRSNPLIVSEGNLSVAKMLN